jgi:hypothetical protein
MSETLDIAALLVASAAGDNSAREVLFQALYLELTRVASKLRRWISRGAVSRSFRDGRPPDDRIFSDVSAGHALMARHNRAHRGNLA